MWVSERKDAKPKEVGGENKFKEKRAICKVLNPGKVKISQVSFNEASFEFRCSSKIL